MNETLAQDLANAIRHRSPMIADNLGLPLTGEELAAVYEIVGKHYLNEVTDLRCLWHRFGRLAQLAYSRLIITLAVWGLADYSQAVIPTWRDIRALRGLADWEQAMKEKRIKRMVDEINRKLKEEAR